MTQKETAIKGQRIVFLDNLRTFMIFFVVVLHCSLVYESSGGAGFFWIVYDYSNIDLFGVINWILDIFVMSTIFFISGYLTPLSLKNKKGWTFLTKDNISPVRSFRVSNGQQ